MKLLKHKKNLSRSRGGNLAVYIMLLLMGLFTALPLMYMVSNAFKPLSELYIFPPKITIANPTLDNFRDMVSLWDDMMVPFERYVFNTIMVTLIGTTVYVFIACLAAYPLAKHKFPGKAVISSLVVWAILFRAEVTAIPQFNIISKLNMLDTYFALVFPILAGTFGVFLVRQFMEGIPNVILEAARIDGLGEFGIFFKIVLPMVKPAWVTLIIFTFQSFWISTGNSYIYSEKLKLLPTALNQLNTAGLSRAGVSAAVMLLLMIVPVIVFLFCQKSVMQTMAHSGIKE